MLNPTNFLSEKYERKLSAIYSNYSSQLLATRFKSFALFYLSYLLLLFLHSMNNITNVNIIKMSFSAILIIIQVYLIFTLKKLQKFKVFKSANKIYFFVINIMNLFLFIEIIEDRDQSIPQNNFFYFWMACRYFSISFMTKIISRSSIVTIPSLFIECIYISIRFNYLDVELYKSILIIVILFAKFSFFFNFIERFLVNNSKIQFYQKDDSRVFKKLLNRLPTGLIIVNEKDDVFYANYNARNMISNSMILNEKKNDEIEILPDELFKSFQLIEKENSSLDNNFDENDIENIIEMNNTHNNLNLKKHFSDISVYNHIKSKNINTLYDLFTYLKTNISSSTDPIVHSLLMTNLESYQDYSKENYLNIDFVTTTNQPHIYNIQMSVIEIREKLHFLFLFDDITITREISKIQEDAIKYKNLLMASVSHELRTPLNCIMNMIETAIIESPPKLKYDYLVPAFNSSKLLFSIINDILDYSMMNANKLRLVFSRFNLKNACLECLQIIENLSKKNGIKVIFNYKKGTPVEIVSEPNRLKQILLNLLGNAIKYTIQGFIKLDVWNEFNSKLIYFSVQDTGFGITIDEKVKIEKLLSDQDYHVQVNKNSTGAGLGLKISSKLVELLNESPELCKGIVCESEPGKGSIFKFSIHNHSESQISTIKSDSNMFDKNMGTTKALKVVISTPNLFKQNSEDFEKIEENIDDDKKSEDLDAESIKGLKKTRKSMISNIFDLNLNNNNNQCNKSEESSNDILKEIFSVKDSPMIKNKLGVLIVDDDLYNREVLKNLLIMLKYKFDSARNGKEALDKILENNLLNLNYELILMDYNMPIMNGIEATKILVEKMNKNELNNINIIGVTAYTNDEDIQACLKAGMKTVLNKPISKKTLQETLKKYI